METEAGTITKNDLGLEIPSHPVIPFIEGDGIGPDIWRATKMVLDQAVFTAYEGKRRISWLELYAGEKAHLKTGSWITDQTLETIQKHGVAIKGPLTTPVGKGIRSLNVTIRQQLDLYACVRPIQYISPVPSPMKNPEKVRMVVFRENTEDVYAGIEWKSGSSEAKRIISFLRQEMRSSIPWSAGIGIKPISEQNTKRLVARAIEYALESSSPSVTLMHKGNIMKFTEGAFKEWGYEIAAEKFPGSTITEEELHNEFEGSCPDGIVVIKDRLADMLFQQVLLRPGEYGVIATTNLNGDYISDALVAQVGGLGMAPGANIGDECAVFEATHGTAPKYAGLDKVNPGSMILSGAMMFDYLGWKEAAEIIRTSLQATIQQGTVTYDLARQMEQTREVKCSEFADCIVKNMRKQY